MTAAGPIGDAVIVVAGGASSRMGRPKAWLDWRGRPLLQHVVDVAADAVGMVGGGGSIGGGGRPGPVIVAAPSGLDLPVLPSHVLRAEDAIAGRGPLQGLAAGLAAASAAGADRAMVLALDLPLMTGAFIRRVLALLEDGWDVALPTIGGHHQPLAAAYRTALAGQASAVLAAGRTGMRGLLDGSRVRAIGEADLLGDAAVAAEDPHLHSVLNVNDDGAYREALRIAADQADR